MIAKLVLALDRLQGSQSRATVHGPMSNWSLLVGAYLCCLGGRSGGVPTVANARSFILRNLNNPTFENTETIQATTPETSKHLNAKPNSDFTGTSLARVRTTGSMACSTDAVKGFKNLR